MDETTYRVAVSGLVHSQCVTGNDELGQVVAYLIARYPDSAITVDVAPAPPVAPPVSRSANPYAHTGFECGAL